MPSARTVANSSWRCTAFTALSTSLSDEMTITAATTVFEPSGNRGTAVAATRPFSMVTVPCASCPLRIACSSIGKSATSGDVWPLESAMSTWLRENTSVRPPKRVDRLFSVLFSAARSEIVACPLLSTPSHGASVSLMMRALPPASASFCSTRRPRRGGTT